MKNPPLAAVIAENYLDPNYLCAIKETGQINIPEHNSNNSFELAISGTCTLDTDCIIRCVFAVMGHTRRLEPTIIIEQVESTLIYPVKLILIRAVLSHPDNIRQIIHPLRFTERAASLLQA